MAKVGGRSYFNYGEAGVEALMGPSLLEPVTKHDDDQFERCRGLWVGTAGTANLTFPGPTEDGIDVDGIPLAVGWNPLQVIGVRTGGDADEIFAGY